MACGKPRSYSDHMEDVPWRFLRGRLRKTTSMKTCPGNPFGDGLWKTTFIFRSHGRRALEVPSGPLEENHVHENVPWKSLRGWLRKTTFHISRTKRAAEIPADRVGIKTCPGNPLGDGFGNPRFTYHVLNVPLRSFRSLRK
jgi:hypothetical protein